MEREWQQQQIAEKNAAMIQTRLGLGMIIIPPCLELFNQ
jgi:hypothetical protein